MVNLEWLTALCRCSNLTLYLEATLASGPDPLLLSRPDWSSLDGTVPLRTPKDTLNSLQTESYPSLHYWTVCNLNTVYFLLTKTHYMLNICTFTPRAHSYGFPLAFGSSRGFFHCYKCTLIYLKIWHISYLMGHVLYVYWILQYKGKSEDYPQNRFHEIQP